LFNVIFEIAMETTLKEGKKKEKKIASKLAIYRDLKTSDMYLNSSLYLKPSVG